MAAGAVGYNFDGPVDVQRLVDEGLVVGIKIRMAAAAAAAGGMTAGGRRVAVALGADGVYAVGIPDHTGVVPEHLAIGAPDLVVLQPVPMAVYLAACGGLGSTLGSGKSEERGIAELDTVYSVVPGRRGAGEAQDAGFEAVPLDIDEVSGVESSSRHLVT